MSFSVARAVLQFIFVEVQPSGVGVTCRSRCEIFVTLYYYFWWQVQPVVSVLVQVQSLYRTVDVLRLKHECRTSFVFCSPTVDTTVVGDVAGAIFGDCTLQYFVVRSSTGWYHIVLCILEV